MQRFLDDIAAYHGNAYLSPSATLTPNTMAALRHFCEHMGMSTDATMAARPTDLIAVYAVTKGKGESAGRSMAVRTGKAIMARGGTPQPVPSIAPQPQPLTAPTIDMEALKAAMADMIAQEVAAGIAAMRPSEPLHLTLSTPSNPEPVALGLCHRTMPYVLRTLAAGENVYLYGPPGSGKTTMGKKCAEALGLPFYATAKIDSEYLLLGFTDANGKTFKTPFRMAFEHGGLFLFDEMDRSNPNAVAAMNMALANGFCAFPDGIVQRHENFLAMGAGNTAMTGATMSASAAIKMEGPTIDRFYFIPFGYDEDLEMAIAPNPDWTRHVQAIRKVVADRGINHDVTPRASISGGNVIANGATWQEAEEGAIFKGLDADTVEQLRHAVRRPAALSLAA